MRPPSRPQLALALLLLSSPAAGQAPAPDVPAVAATGAFFALAVDDLEASTRWYVEQLGLAVTRRHPRANGIAVTILEGPGMLVELVHREGASRAGGSPNGTPEIGLFKAGLMVADFEATVAALRARGVEIVAGPFPERPDQRANVIIRDNSGNLIQVLGPASATPPSRAHHALVYHAAMGRVLLLGGSTPLDGGSRFRFFDDVWAFDGLRWTAVGTMPVAQSGQAVAYDPRDGSVLSVGGYTGRALGHVLRFRGNEWTLSRQGLPPLGVGQEFRNAQGLGQPGLPVSLGSLMPGAAVFDMVYSPLETPLLEEARSRGLLAIDGLTMLIEQAAEAFACFFRASAPRDHDAELRVLGEVGRVEVAGPAADQLGNEPLRPRIGLGLAHHVYPPRLLEGGQHRAHLPGADVRRHQNEPLARGVELLVEHVEHLEERHVGGHVGELVGVHRPGGRGVRLAPDLEGQVHAHL